jgi:hypothetical protein
MAITHMAQRPGELKIKISNEKINIKVRDM